MPSSAARRGWWRPPPGARWRPAARTRPSAPASAPPRRAGSDERSLHACTGLHDLVQRSLLVLRLEVHRPHAFQQHDRVESLSLRIQGGLLHAVVGGEPQDDQPFDAVVAEDRLEAGALGLTALRVAAGEPRLA